jgi:hypothetical protein
MIHTLMAVDESDDWAGYVNDGLGRVMPGSGSFKGVIRLE